jgi:hypothetical protein
MTSDSSNPRYVDFEPYHCAGKKIVIAHSVVHGIHVDVALGIAWKGPAQS